MDAKSELKKTVDELSINEKVFLEEGTSSASDDSQNNENENSGLEDIEKLAQKIDAGRDVKKTSFQDGLDSLGITENDLFELIMQIANDGYYEKKYSLYKGSVNVVFRSATLLDADSFLKEIEDANLKTESRTTFILGLYVLASVLREYNGADLSEKTVQEKVEYIKNNIPPIFFKALKFEAASFSELMEFAGSQEVADFF